MNQQTLPTQTEIKERLVKELNVAHLAKEEQDDVITKMSTVLLDRITMAVVSQLPKEDMARIDTLMKNGQNDAVHALITQRVPEIKDIVELTIAQTLGQYQSILNNTTQN